MIATAKDFSLTALSKISQGQFCALVTSSAGMYALVVDTSDIATVAADVTEEIGGLLEDQPPLHLQVKDLKQEQKTAGSPPPDRAQELATGVAASAAPVRILSGLERLADQDWATLNFARSRLLGEHSLVFLLDRRSLVLLQQQAPDLDHLLTSATWQLDQQADALSAAARAQRLAALRAWSGLTDEEVVRKAKNSELPADPDYAEWLVLLGKGELLVG